MNEEVKIWYVVNRHSLTMKEIEVVKETEKFLTQRCRRYHSRHPYYEQRIAKETEYDKAFNEWKDAHAYLLECANQKLRLIERQLTQTREKLEAISAMVKPSENI